MKAYDPLEAPDPADWESLDEQERIALVLAHHRQAGIKLPDEVAHATIHVIVENQVGMGTETPVRATLDRLLSEGLDRHDAIHAIGSVLAEHLNDLMEGRPGGSAPNNVYYEHLKALTAQTWRADFG